jgi:hypothetical protein
MAQRVVSQAQSTQRKLAVLRSLSIAGSVPQANRECLGLRQRNDTNHLKKAQSKPGVRAERIPRPKPCGPVPIWLKGRVFLREQRARDIYVVFRSDLFLKFREFHRDFPADILPILSGGPELQRFRTFPAIGLSNADRTVLATAYSLGLIISSGFISALKSSSDT